MTSITNDLFHKRINLDFHLIFQCFGNLHIALSVWLIMQLCTAVLVFMGFYYWANNRVSYLANPKDLSALLFLNFKAKVSFNLSEIYDIVWLTIYITYIILFLVLPCREIVKHQLPVASSLVVLLEQVGCLP